MRRALLLTCLAVLWPHAAGAAQPITLRVDMSAPGHAVRRLEVDNDALVIVDLRKTTFQSCTVDTKSEPLPPPPNPIGQALASLTPFLALPAAEAPSFAPRVRTPVADAVLEHELQALAADAKAARDEVATQRDAARAALLDVPHAVACTDRACSDIDVARARLGALRRTLGSLVDTPAAPVAILNARASILSKALIEKLGASDDEDAWARDALRRFDAVQRMLDATGDARDAFAKAKDALAPLLGRLDAFVPAVEQTVPLAVARDAKVTVTIGCVDAVTLEPKVYREHDTAIAAVNVPPATTTIVYQDVPWATVTAGMLYSQLDARQVGAAPVRIGTDATGAVTFERRVAETDHAATQLIPATFLNIAACRCRQWVPAVAIGFGLNANNGAKLLEYFVGGALIVHQQLAIQIGRHLGSTQQPANGFAEGDVLPDKLTDVPTIRRRDGALAIGLSFRIPLPK
ncbi:MAG TPA: hypothetical protein VI258_14510 [Rhodanobacteraceae bacterium]